MWLLNAAVTKTMSGTRFKNTWRGKVYGKLLNRATTFLLACKTIEMNFCREFVNNLIDFQVKTKTFLMSIAEDRHKGAQKPCNRLCCTQVCAQHRRCVAHAVYRTPFNVCIANRSMCIVHP